MKYFKNAIDYSDQITILKQRGLLIDDENEALDQLKIISYFRLANYLRPMELNKQTHQFKPNSHFNNALSLYYFDKALRALIFTAVQSIEVAIRSKMIHFVSMKHGPFWIMDSQLYSNPMLFKDNLEHIKKEVIRSKEDFIEEHFQKYSSPDIPPAWKTLEVISFGSLSKLYSTLSDKSVKKDIARSLGLPQHIFLESWIMNIAILRNRCAHHARIWNRKFSFSPQMPHKLPLPWLTNNTSFAPKLYPQLCCLLYLQNAIHPENTFKQQLLTLFNEYPNVDLKAMGFPKDWNKEPLWA